MRSKGSLVGLWRGWVVVFVVGGRVRRVRREERLVVGGRVIWFGWVGRRAVCARWRWARRRVSGGQCIGARWSLISGVGQLFEHRDGELE